MDFARFVREISFRALPAHRFRPQGMRALNRFLSRWGVDLERLNTRLPRGHEEVARRVSALRRVPRMSTFAIGAVIHRAVDDMPADACFLNIGIWQGYTFLAGSAEQPHKRCIGVDNFVHGTSDRVGFLKRFEATRSPKHEVVLADYREYLRQRHQEPIGVYLYDGPHSYADQFDALQLAEPHFAADCVTIVDDTNYDHVRRANLDFIKGSRNRYELLLDARTAQNGHPTWWNGLMVFRLVGANVAAAPRLRRVG